ncbi:TPA: DUF551 domain-containing protein [Klebsiella pneumoniae]
MTKSTITREQLEEWVAQFDEDGGCDATDRQLEALIRQSLVAMDSEPVIVVGDDGGDALSYRRLIQSFEPGTKLYRHAQPAKTVQPVMLIDGDISSEDADKLAKVIREFNEEDERPLAKMARIIRENPHPINECDMPKGQPAPVSLTEAQVAALEEEEKSCHDGIRKCIASLRYHHKRAEAHSTGYKGSTLEDDTLKSINFLKRNIIAAMFRAEPVTTANKLGNSPVQSDCCPAQNQGWIPVSERMPDNTEPVLCIEKRADFGTYGQPFVCWHDGGGWVGKTNYRPIVTHWMPLPAAPQEVKSES